MVSETKVGTYKGWEILKDTVLIRNKRVQASSITDKTLFLFIQEDQSFTGKLLPKRSLMSDIVASEVIVCVKRPNPVHISPLQVILKLRLSNCKPQNHVSSFHTTDGIRLPKMQRDGEKFWCNVGLPCREEESVLVDPQKHETQIFQIFRNQ